MFLIWWFLNFGLGGVLVFGLFIIELQERNWFITNLLLFSNHQCCKLSFTKNVIFDKYSLRYE